MDDLKKDLIKLAIREMTVKNVIELGHLSELIILKACSKIVLRSLCQTMLR